MNRFQKSLVAGTAGIAALAVVGSAALAHGSGGYRQGAELGYGGMMGPGQGMMNPGQGGMQVTPSRDLTAEDVRHFLEHRLEMHGNDRLKVGEVEEVDDDTITAEVVTVDDSLVERFEVDRHSGRMMPQRPAAGDAPSQQSAN